MMESESPPQASPPIAKDNTEVLSRRIPGQGEAQEAVPVVPKGKTPVTEHMGGHTPMDTDDGGHIQFGPSRIPLWRPKWLRIQAVRLFRTRGASQLHR